MNIYFLTEGGKKEGYGHIVRCQALAHAFKQQQKTNKIHFIVNTDAHAEKYLGRERLSYQKKNWIKEIDQIIFDIEAHSIVIIDSYHATEEIYSKLAQAQANPYLVALDDDHRLDYDVDLIFNPSVFDKKEVGYGRHQVKKVLAGRQYTILRPIFSRIKPKLIKRDVKNVMITLGGSQNPELIVRIAEALSEYNFNIHAVVPNVLKIKGVQVHSALSAKEMNRLMQKIDVCITAGGNTLNECSSLGLPTICLLLADNQYANIMKYKKAQFIQFIGKATDASFIEKLHNAMNYYQDPIIRKEKSLLGQDLIDGKGTMRTIQKILFSFYAKDVALRKASLDDAKSVFRISNDIIVRAASGNIQKVTWQEHMNWIKGKLDDPNNVFYVLDVLNNVYGQVRFDMDADSKDAVMSISLDKRIRGIHLGSYIIEKSVKQFLKEQKKVNRIKAIVKEENESSLKAFEKAHFQYKRDLLVNNVESKEFEFQRN